LNDYQDLNMHTIRNLRHSILAFLAAIVFVSASWAQDTNTADEPGEEVEATESPEPDPADVDVDDGSYLDEDEENFRPSEEIPADQSIPFPTDI